MNAVALLCAASSHPEPRHHLIHDEERAFALGNRTQPFEESLIRGDEPHVPGHRLHEDGGDVAGVRAEERADLIEIVVTRQQGIGHHGRGHPRAVGDTQRHGPRTCLD
jgi:hypothetical protein